MADTDKLYNSVAAEKARAQYVKNLLDNMPGGGSDVNYDTTNKKLTKTTGGTTTDIVTVATLKTDMALAKGDVGLGNVTNDSQVKRSEMGAASGVATLDSSGKVPSSQLPSYVDDVVEGYLYNGVFYKESAHTTAITGETGKIYVNLSNDKSYRWSGSAYTEISSSDVTGIKVGSGGSTITPSQGVIELPEYEAGAQVHIAPTATEVKSALGTGSGTTKYLREDGTWQKPTDNNTTYKLKIGSTTNGDSANGVDLGTLESKAAANNGTDLSLVTTGEKYIWDNKQNKVTALGSTSTPVYISADGTFSKSSTYAGGTKVTLNGSSKAASTASFYAPTAAGTSGQVLLSSGGAPNWKTGDIIHYVTSTSGTAGSGTSGSYNRTQWTGTVAGVTALYTGLTVMFKIPIAGVAGGASLNINSLGEHPVVLNANTLLTTHYPVNSIMVLIYDSEQEGSVYVNGTLTEYTGCWKIHNYDSNTKYSAMSESEGKTGTATTARTITAAVLKEVIDDRGYIAASSLGAWAKAANKPSYTLDEVTDGSTRKLSDYLPAIQKTYVNSTSAKWSIFAKISSSTTSRYNDCIALVQGLGNYYSGGMTGAWIVEMRTNNSAVPSMTATCLSPAVSTSTIEFGYYIDSEAGFIYYGVKTSTRRGAFSVVPLRSTNYTLLNDADLTTAPTGWTAATYRDLQAIQPANEISNSATTLNIDGTIPLHVITTTVDITSIGFTASANRPPEGQSCHAIIKADTQKTVTVAYNATYRVTPDGNDITLTIPAGGYVELDWVTAGGVTYMRGIQ